jgi:3-dehydroquinate synthase
MKIYRSRLHGGAPIYFGEGAREMLLSEVDDRKPDRVFIVTDRTVEALYLEPVKELLPGLIPVEVVVFNEGEENKNLATLQHVAGDLLRAGATDASLVLNVGGGGVLDVGGLAASLLGRGLRFGHVATTTNAIWQVATDDRQAIHFVGGRNTFGVHRAPEFAIADTLYLETEDPAQTRGALVEFVQLALVLGGDVYERALAALTDPGFVRAPGLIKTLEQCIEIKLSTFENEAARARAEMARRYGDPLARCLQILAEGRLTGAEALYYGMRMAAEIARESGAMDEAGYKAQADLLDRLDLDVKFPANVQIDRFVYKMHGNNKTLRDGNMLVLLRRPGELAAPDGAGPETAVSDAHVAEAFEKIRLRG